MSTTLIDTSRPGIGFGRLVRVELRKMTNTRAGRALVIITIGLLLLAAGILLLTAALDDSFDPSASNFATVMQFVSLLILPVFAVMITTSEWTQRTNLTTFTLEPRRSRVVLAKFAATAVFSVITLAIAIGAGAAANAATSMFDQEPVWDLGASDLAWSLLLQFMLIFSAFALGMAFLNTASAIALFYVAAIMLRFIVYPIMMGIFSWFADLVPFLDMFFAVGVAQSGEGLSEGQPVGDIARYLPIAVSTIIWVVVPGFLGWMRATRSEIK